MKKVIFSGIIILSLITNHFLLLFSILIIGCITINLTAVILGIIGKITGNNSLLISFLNKLKNYDIEVGYDNHYSNNYPINIKSNTNDYNLPEERSYCPHSSTHDWHNDPGSRVNPSSGLHMGSSGFDSAGNPYGTGNWGSIDIHPALKSKDSYVANPRAS